MPVDYLIELCTRAVDGGFFAKRAAGRIGRGTKLPPQFGQIPFKVISTQAVQKVHSKEQICALAADGGKSQSQRSQLGRSCSIYFPS
ncbi:hypothetical protein BH11PSE12_BH11PSE12_26860 [soil metagenome]